LNNEGFEDFKSRVHPNDLGYIMQKEEDAIQQGDSDYQAEFRIIRRSGEIRYINANVQIKRNEEGKVLKLIGTAHDVTLVKQQVEERRKLINDLLNQNKELQQFNYIVSHNLRSPVANLIGLAKLYRKGETSERNDKIIENILQSAESIDLVLKDLSQILQMRGDISLEREMVNIHDVLSTVLKTIAPQMESMEVEIKTDFSAASEIFTVKSYLNSILYNLISNAIKYRHPDRKCLIEMETGKTENYFYLHVRDNGIGFDTEKNKEKLFGLYKRFHSHVEGKGIGLYLVKVQAETLGGWVEVESEVGKGTVFTVFISINS
jgi:signal transduction histidine kinase